MAGFTFDRSKLKSTSASAQQKQTNELASKGFGGGGRTEFIQIKEGEQTLRVFPFHPEGGGDNFAEVKCVSWLDVEVPKRDESGKKVGEEKEIKPKGIFNSKVHGGLPIDLVEEYITFAKDRAIPDATGDNKEEAKKIWEKIVGSKDKKPQPADKYKPIRPNTSWVAYAAKLESVDADSIMHWGKVCPWEIKKSIKDAMTEKAAEYQSPDPFSDPDEGIPVVVTLNKKALKPADFYKTKMLQKREGNGFVYIPAPLDNGKLEEWFALKPLYKLYVNSFKRSDLLMQIDGLQRLDLKLNEDHPGFSVFGYQEFEEIINTLLEAMPEEEKAEEGEEQTEEQQGPAETPKPTPKSVSPAKPPVVATTPKPAATKLSVPVKPTVPVLKKPAPVPEPEENDGEESHDEPKVEQEVKLTGTDAKSRLAEIQAKFGRKQ